MRILFISILISCSNFSLEKEMEWRIEKFNSIEKTYFTNVYIYAVRNEYKQNEVPFKVKRIGRPDKALFSIGKKNILHQNFFEQIDTNSIDFINEFGKLNCRTLYNKDDNTVLTFIYRKYKIILWKGTPEFVYPGLNPRDFMEHRNEWKYVIQDFKGDN